MKEIANANSALETLAPADTAAVSDAVRAAAREKRAVFPRGMTVDPMNAGEHPGATACDVVLSLEKLRRLVDYQPEDMTITVEAGMTFAEFAEILAAKNQWLPIDVPHPDRTTLGGLVAVNHAGPRRLGYGTIRDYLLGFTAIDGTGVVFHGGGRVVKNAAGYNLPRLMAGSRGTLGVLTELTFMVRPRPETTAVASCKLSDIARLEELLASLFRGDVRPVAVDLIVDDAAKLFVAFDGAAADVRWMIGALTQKHVDTENVAWDENAVLDEMCFCSASWCDSMVVRFSLLPSRVVEFVAALRTRMDDCRIRAHAGNGIVYAAMPAALCGSLRALAESYSGTMTVASLPRGVALSREEIWGPPPAGFAIMRAIKERFDPHNILNPGQYIFA
jgi:glycolate oxidase FAD binding subunit